MGAYVRENNAFERTTQRLMRLHTYCWFDTDNENYMQISAKNGMLSITND